MIIDAILNLLLGIFQPLVSALPTGTLPTGLVSVGHTIRGYIWAIDRFVPIAEPFGFLFTLVVSTIPAFIAWRVGTFIFDKIRGA